MAGFVKLGRQLNKKPKPEPDPSLPKPRIGRPPIYKSAKGLDSEEVCRLLAEERGMLTYVAQRLGISRFALRSFIDQSGPCAKALYDAREAMGDVAEKKLFEMIEAGDVRCIMYYLSTAQRHRGYGVKRAEDAPFGEAKQVVNTVNIVSIPSGQFLSKDEIANLTIDNYPSATLPAPEAEPALADCLQ